jgi:hypothetical protein
MKLGHARRYIASLSNLICIQSVQAPKIPHLNDSRERRFSFQEWVVRNGLADVVFD